MKWKKLGKIFDPTEHTLSQNCFEFSQSPQALVLSDRIRIYFSTREKDNVGKYLSHISFVDFNKNMTSIIAVSKHSIIKLGDLGCFDEHGIFPLNPLKDKQNRVLAYTTGLNRKSSVPIDSSIGLAISYDDGYTFEKYGKGPVMTASLKEPFLIADAFVKLYDDLYHMWYIYGIKWKKYSQTKSPERIYKIAHAVSTDGKNWTRDAKQIISSTLNEDECQALPTVFQKGSRYHMYFCYRQAHSFREQSKNAYRIGYAYSDDLTTWTRDDQQSGISTSFDGWDSEMICYPHVFDVGDKTYMLYNGNSFGKLGFGLALLEDI